MFRLGCATLATAALLGACTGQILDPDPQPGAEGPWQPGAKQALCKAEPSPGEAPIRRLSNAEYRNTVTDLFGDAALAAEVTSTFPPETESLGFRNGAKFLQVAEPVATAFMDAAERLSEAAATKTDLLPCTPAAGSESTCTAQTIEVLGRKLYRRPLEPAELASYQGVFQKGVAQGGFSEGVRWTLYTMLQSPHFLYRVEFGQPSSKGATRPTHYEMASRLSYLLWQSSPDEELFAAAAAGELGTKAEVLAQARRMVADPKARRVLQFFDEWLDVDQLSAMQRDTTAFPSFDAELASDLAEETRTFVERTVFDQNGDLTTLLTAPHSYLNANLAEHYGVSGPSGQSFVKTSMPGRAGILTQGGVVSVHDRQTRTSIVSRGVKIRTDFLCQTIGAPPDDVVLVLKDLSAETNQRKRLEEHRANPACAACHDLVDPIGVVFEGFDALGRARDKDEFGSLVDTKSVLNHTQDADGPVNDPVELAERLAGSVEVRACFTTQAFRFFYGRAESEADACSQQQLYDAFAKSELRVTELLVALTQTDAFLYRPTNVEGQP